MKTISTFTVLATLLCFGSGTPLTRKLSLSFFDELKSEVHPQAVDFSEVVQSIVNNIIATNLSKPLVIWPPHVLPIVLPIGELIPNGRILGDITIDGITIDVSSANLNDSKVVAANLLTPFDLELGLAVPSITISGFYKLDAKVGGLLGITGNGSYLISIQDLYVALTDGKLRIIGGIKLTAMEYVLSLGAISANFEGMKISGVESTELVNELVNELFSLVLLPYVRDTLEPMLHPWIRAVVHDTINELIPSLLPLTQLLDGAIASHQALSARKNSFQEELYSKFQ